MIPLYQKFYCLGHICTIIAKGVLFIRKGKIHYEVLFIISNLLITPLLYADEEFFEAINDNNIAKTQFMVETEEVDVNKPNRDGHTPLIKAVSQDPTITKILLKAKADPNIGNSSKVKPLHRAAEAGHVENAELFLEAGAKVDAIDAWGETALMIAVQNEDPRMIRLILRYNPDLTISNNRGQTVLTIAGKHRNQRIYKMLTAKTKSNRTARMLHTVKSVISTDIESETVEERRPQRCPY